MMFSKALPVFPEGKAEEQNIFATFRTEVGSLKEASLYITAASFYQVYVNRQFVAFGPARTAKGYARMDVLNLERFDAGEKNEIVIAVIGYHTHSLSTVCQPSFLMAEVRRGDTVLCFTGRDFEGYLPTCKLQKTERYSVQRHFTEIWDFRNGTSLTPSQARVPLAVSEHTPTVLNRVAPYPYYEDIMLNKASCQGKLAFDEALPYRASASSFTPDTYWGCFTAEEIVSRPFEWIQRQKQTICEKENKLPLELNENEYAIFDFSKIEAGFLKFCATAEESADIVFAFSEDASPEHFQFTNMNAENVLEYFMQADQTLDTVSFEPYVMRYLIVAVRTGRIRLQQIGIKTFVRDVHDLKTPALPDATLTSIYRGAVRTFAHNAVDLFMDCPSRERAGWLCDSYFTAKTEYALFQSTAVEDAFLENYVLFQNEGEYPDGVIPMCYPSDPQPTQRYAHASSDISTASVTENKFIPQWTMWYILEVEDYLRNRNQTASVETFRPSIEGLLRFYKKHENADGLLEKLPSWNFVEWSRANEWTQDVNYPTNFLYAQVLRCAYNLFGDEAYLRRSKEVCQAAIQQSFNGKVFLDHAIREEDGTLKLQQDCSEACQYYAILFGGIDICEPKYSELYRLVTQVFGADRKEDIPEIAEINAFIGIYLRLEALLKMNQNQLVLSDIRNFFGKMEAETGTLWEYRQRKGSRDHGFASYALVAMMKALRNLAETEQQTL